MMLRVVLATLHLLALGIGLGAVWARARALRRAPDAAAVRRALVADTWWGVAAGLWVTTGVWRFLGGLEKPLVYYLQNHVFLGKLGLFVLVVGLEIWPMVKLIQWRMALRRGERPEFESAGAIARISTVQAWILIAMVIAATAMARGVGMTGG